MSGKKRFLSGYRLHLNRILFSGGKIIRTIKYPLKPLNDFEENNIYFKKFANAIIADDLKIRGNLNLNDYFQISDKNGYSYTLFNFWVDSLKAGVIWSPTPSKLIDLVNSPPR